MVPLAMKVDRIRPADFFEALSRTAATVCVVTTDGSSGRAGLTVSSMCSVSAEPPSLLVCVNEESGVCGILQDNAVMCVNVLRAEQAYISDAFSGRLTDPNADPFASTQWETAVTGAPVMSKALVNLDCRIKNELHHGTHYIFVGEIVSLRLNQPGAPLVYRARMYEQLGESGSLSLEDMEYSWERYT